MNVSDEEIVHTDGLGTFSKKECVAETILRHISKEKIELASEIVLE
jgi:hypothetical protein